MFEPLLNTVDSMVTALEALATVNEFLSDHLPARFTADQAEWVSLGWCVPVVLAYPHTGSLKRVGMVEVDGKTAAIVSHTLFDQIKTTGMALYNEHRNAIAAAFLSAGNALLVCASLL